MSWKSGLIKTTIGVALVAGSVYQIYSSAVNSPVYQANRKAAIIDKREFDLKIDNKSINVKTINIDSLEYSVGDAKIKVDRHLFSGGYDINITGPAGLKIDDSQTIESAKDLTAKVLTELSLQQSNEINRRKAKVSKDITSLSIEKP